MRVRRRLPAEPGEIMQLPLSQGISAKPSVLPTFTSAGHCSSFASKRSSVSPTTGSKSSIRQPGGSCADRGRCPRLPAPGSLPRTRPSAFSGRATSNRLSARLVDVHGKQYAGPHGFSSRRRKPHEREVRRIWPLSQSIGQGGPEPSSTNELSSTGLGSLYD